MNGANPEKEELIWGQQDANFSALLSGPKWFQLYFTADLGMNRVLIQRAKAAGCTAIVFSVDLEWAGNRERDLRTGFTFPASLPFPNLPNAKSGVTLAELFKVFKRNLDFADIEFIRKESGLPVVVKGILSPDNAKECVAHGASAVAIGRPTLYGLSLGGWQGVKTVFDTINKELLLAMKLAGCARIEDISRRFVA